jgi:hypothetical protein
MRIGEAFNQFKAEFHVGNLCHAIGNFFQNVKSSFGDKEKSSTMESKPTVNAKSLGAGSASPLQSSAFVKNTPKLTQEAWFTAYNREKDDLQGQSRSTMKTFFDGPTPTFTDTSRLDNMTLADAKQLLGIRDGEETRLSAHDRGEILKGEARKVYNEGMAGKVFTEAPEISPDRTDKLRHMEQKIQKAVELVEDSGLQIIPEPGEEIPHKNPWDD